MGGTFMAEMGGAVMVMNIQIIKQIRGGAQWVEFPFC